MSHSMPPLAEILGGSLFERRRRCGNPYCHCSEDEGHLTVYLGVRLASGKIEQISIRQELAPLAKKWVANYKQLMKIIDAISEKNRQHFRRDHTSRRRGRNK